MTLSLPLPSAKLSPNGRCHWRAKSQLTKLHRERARLFTLSHLHGGYNPGPFTRYTLTFYFPDARRRDDDNAIASCKAYRDGIADALGIDDHSLSLSASPIMAVDKANTRVEFTLLP